MTKSKTIGWVAIIALVGVWIATNEQRTDVAKATSDKAKVDTQHIDLLYKLGEASVNSGFVTTYDVSGWNQRLNLHISSLLPGDARTINEAVCNEARSRGVTLPSLRGWEIRTFILASDETPAAVCRL
jgi:hypothetical protein